MEVILFRSQPHTDDATSVTFDEWSALGAHPGLPACDCLFSGFFGVYVVAAASIIKYAQWTANKCLSLPVVLTLFCCTDICIEFPKKCTSDWRRSALGSQSLKLERVQGGKDKDPHKSLEASLKRLVTPFAAAEVKEGEDGQFKSTLLHFTVLSIVLVQQHQLTTR